MKVRARGTEISNEKVKKSEWRKTKEIKRVNEEKLNC